MVCPNCKTESGPSLFCYVCDAYLPSMAEGVKASIPSRLGAYLLDGIVLLTMLVIIGLIAISVGVNVSSVYRDHGLEAFLIIFFGGWLCYFGLFVSLLAHGQTPGKWFMDIRAVEKRNGAEPGLGRMLLRETLGKWVSGCFFGLGWFWAIWDRDAQAWHDKIVRTVVLYRRTESRKSLALGFLFGALVLFAGLTWASFDHALNNRHQNSATFTSKAADLGYGLAQSNLGASYPHSQGVPQNDTQRAAERGDPTAQYVLGRMYYHGIGVPQDYKRAAYWYRKAAEQGDANAQYNLGVLYKSGLGESQDYAQAATWLRKAAEQGNAPAQDNLGNLYFSGEGVLQDYTQAAYWCRKAAERGDAHAQYDLGSLYYLGNGVPQDFAQAYFWIALAASGKLEGVKREDVEQLLDDAASHLTPAELSQVQERVRKWLEQHPPKVE